jgi:hypothetical protein
MICGGLKFTSFYCRPTKQGVLQKLIARSCPERPISGLKGKAWYIKGLLTGPFHIPFESWYDLTCFSSPDGAGRSGDISTRS